MDAVKVYGLRRTGTNYLQWLLVHNFRQLVVLVDAFAWKHGLPKYFHTRVFKDTNNWSEKDYSISLDLEKLPPKISRVHYVLCVKDPYSWYLSICKWRNIEPFPLNRDKLEQLFLWNYMILVYEKFVHQKCEAVIIKYEDLLSNLDWALQDLADRFCLFRTSSLVDTDDNVYSGELFSKKRHFYATKKYLKLYSPKDFEMMRGFLDTKLMERLEYKLR